MACRMVAEKQTSDKPRVGDGTPGPGRKKGIPNKITAAAKSVIEEAAEKLGGCNRLVAWAQEDPKNEHAFWSSIYPKLIPLNVTGSIKVDLTQALAAARARVGG